jgi:hypothetical protein
MMLEIAIITLVLNEQQLISQTLAPRGSEWRQPDRRAQRVAFGCRVGAARGAMVGTLCAAHV